MTEAKGTTGKIPGPEALQRRITSDWTDYNRHLNVTWITYLFDVATDNLLDWLGLGETYATEEKRSTFALEAHLRYLGEVREGQEVALRSRLVGADSKRIHYVHELTRLPDGAPVATLEQLSIHVDLDSRRSLIWPETLRASLDAAAAGPGDVPLCGAIGLRG